jgi:hypothetical protein
VTGWHTDGFGVVEFSTGSSAFPLLMRDLFASSQRNPNVAPLFSYVETWRMALSCPPDSRSPPSTSNELSHMLTAIVDRLLAMLGHKSTGAISPTSIVANRDSATGMATLPLTVLSQCLAALPWNTPWQHGMDAAVSLCNGVIALLIRNKSWQLVVHALRLAERALIHSFTHIYRGTAPELLRHGHVFSQYQIATHLPSGSSGSGVTDEFAPHRRGVAPFEFRAQWAALHVALTEVRTRGEHKNASERAQLDALLIHVTSRLNRWQANQRATRQAERIRRKVELDNSTSVLPSLTEARQAFVDRKWLICQQALALVGSEFSWAQLAPIFSSQRLLPAFELVNNIIATQVRPPRLHQPSEVLSPISMTSAMISGGGASSDPLSPALISSASGGSQRNWGPVYAVLLLAHAMADYFTDQTLSLLDPLSPPLPASTPAEPINVTPYLVSPEFVAAFPIATMMQPVMSLPRGLWSVRQCVQYYRWCRHSLTAIGLCRELGTHVMTQQHGHHSGTNDEHTTYRPLTASTQGLLPPLRELCELSSAIALVDAHALNENDFWSCIQWHLGIALEIWDVPMILSLFHAAPPYPITNDNTRATPSSSDEKTVAPTSLNGLSTEWSQWPLPLHPLPLHISVLRDRLCNHSLTNWLTSITQSLLPLSLHAPLPAPPAISYADPKVSIGMTSTSATSTQPSLPPGILPLTRCYLPLLPISTSSSLPSIPTVLDAMFTSAKVFILQTDTDSKRAPMSPSSPSSQQGGLGQQHRRLSEGTLAAHSEWRDDTDVRIITNLLKRSSTYLDLVAGMAAMLPSSTELNATTRRTFIENHSTPVIRILWFIIVRHTLFQLSSRLAHAPTSPPPTPFDTSTIVADREVTRNYRAAVAEECARWALRLLPFTDLWPLQRLQAIALGYLCEMDVGPPLVHLLGSFMPRALMPGGRLAMTASNGNTNVAAMTREAAPLKIRYEGLVDKIKKTSPMFYDQFQSMGNDRPSQNSCPCFSFVVILVLIGLLLIDGRARPPSTVPPTGDPEWRDFSTRVLNAVSALTVTPSIGMIVIHFEIIFVKN